MIENNRVEIEELCKRYSVARLDLFGSASGSEFDPAVSDLDFVASFAARTPAPLFDRYFGLKEDLERLFDGKWISLWRAP